MPVGRPKLDEKDKKTQYKRVAIRLSEIMKDWRGQDVKKAAEWAINKGYKREREE